jgi:hypothetical protein
MSTARTMRHPAIIFQLCWMSSRKCTGDDDRYALEDKRSTVPIYGNVSLNVGQYSAVRCRVLAFLFSGPIALAFPEYFRLSAWTLALLDIEYLLGDFPNQPAPTTNFGRVLGTGCIGHSTIFRTVVAVGSGTPVDYFRLALRSRQGW